MFHFALVAACLASINTAFADSLDDTMPSGGNCAAPHVTALGSELGSVGFMKNIAEHPESIRAVAKRLLTKAVESEAFAERPQCDGNCGGAQRSQVVYKVEPTVFLAEKEQQQLCLDLEEQTRSEPMRFDARSFESIDKLNDWLMEFSQGRGDDGKLLYEQCGGNCSPRYTFRISQNKEALTVSADVLCGLARDRLSDLYAVSTAIQWRCDSN